MKELKNTAFSLEELIDNSNELQDNFSNLVKYDMEKNQKRRTIKAKNKVYASSIFAIKNF